MSTESDADIKDFQAACFNSDDKDLVIIGRLIQPFINDAGYEMFFTNDQGEYGLKQCQADFIKGNDCEIP